MKWLLRLAVQLYPGWWRQRYGREFEALLDDLKPGWRELSDVIHGALTMQIKTVGTIPVACALAGAIVGGIIAIRTPEVFASSATIALKANRESAAAQEFRVSLERALGSSSETRKATSVTLQRADSAQLTLLKLTYLDPDPAQAQRVAERLTAAMATGNSERAASIEILDAPDLPKSPIGPDYPMTVASGGGVGLVAGGVVFLLLRSRRRPATVA
jgi:uncharacterized protein involved in exopolysaccharide biosynthesis